MGKPVPRRRRRDAARHVPASVSARSILAKAVSPPPYSQSQSRRTHGCGHVMWRGNTGRRGNSALDFGRAICPLRSLLISTAARVCTFPDDSSPQQRSDNIDMEHLIAGSSRSWTCGHDEHSYFCWTNGMRIGVRQRGIASPDRLRRSFPKRELDPANITIPGRYTGRTSLLAASRVPRRPSQAGCYTRPPSSHHRRRP